MNGESMYSRDDYTELVVDKKKAGLYPKFNIGRTDLQHLPGSKHFNCDYFVLDLTHDPFAMAAIAAYAAVCEAEYPQLSADLKAKVQPAKNGPAELGMANERV